MTRAVAGMTTLDAPHAWYSPLLAVLLVGLLFAATWAVLHGTSLLLDVHRRGRERVRAAKHREVRR